MPIGCARADRLRHRWRLVGRAVRTLWLRPREHLVGHICADGDLVGRTLLLIGCGADEIWSGAPVRALELRDDSPNRVSIVHGLLAVELTASETVALYDATVRAAERAPCSSRSHETKLMLCDGKLDPRVASRRLRRNWLCRLC